jgi:hypothetical protein
VPDNTFRELGEKLARSLDEHIGREFSESSQALEVRLAVAEYFRKATISARL